MRILDSEENEKQYSLGYTTASRSRPQKCSSPRSSIGLTMSRTCHDSSIESTIPPPSEELASPQPELKPRHGHWRLCFTQGLLLSLLAITLFIGQQLHVVQLKKLKRKQLNRLQQNTHRNDDATLPSLPDGVRVFYKVSGKIPSDFYSNDLEAPLLLCAEPPMELVFRAAKEAFLAALFNLPLRKVDQNSSHFEALLISRMYNHASVSLLDNDIDATEVDSPANQFASFRQISKFDTSTCTNESPRKNRLADCKFLSFLQINFWMQMITMPIRFYRNFRCNFEYHSKNYYHDIYGKSLKTLSNGTLSAYRSLDDISRSANVYESVPTLKNLNVFFQRGGFDSPCYPLLYWAQRILTSNLGVMSYLLLILGWILNSLYSIHPVTIVHAPRLFLYGALVIYRCVVLYILGNFVEYHIISSRSDFSDHIVLHMLYLLIVSIELMTLYNNCETEYRRKRKRRFCLSTNWAVYWLLCIYYLSITVVLLYLSLYTAWFLHRSVEIWAGFLIGCLGLIALFWMLIYTGKLNLSCTGFTTFIDEEADSIAGPTPTAAAYSISRMVTNLSRLIKDLFVYSTNYFLFSEETKKLSHDKRV